MRAADQPLRIAFTAQMVPAVDARDTVEDPGGGHILGGSDEPETILVHRSAATGERADKLHGLTATFICRRSMLP
jgi:hypothetical protein